MKSIKYKGFDIKCGDRRYTLEVVTITKGKNGPRQQYFGGANTIFLAKQKIDNLLK